MEKKEFALTEDFVWEAPVMEEFKVLSRFHGEEAKQSGGDGPSYGDCESTETKAAPGEWE